MYLQSLAHGCSGIDQSVVSSLLSTPSADKTDFIHLQGLLSYAKSELIISGSASSYQSGKGNLSPKCSLPYFRQVLEEFLAMGPSPAEKFSSSTATFCHMPASNLQCYSHTEPLLELLIPTEVSALFAYTLLLTISILLIPRLVKVMGKRRPASSVLRLRHEQYLSFLLL